MNGLTRTNSKPDGSPECANGNQQSTGYSTRLLQRPATPIAVYFTYISSGGVLS
jgi:hypothetical protein